MIELVFRVRMKNDDVFKMVMDRYMRMCENIPGVLGWSVISMKEEK